MNKSKILNVTLNAAPPKGSLPSITFRGKPLKSKSGKEVDLVFVIDTTGSMSDKIEGVLNTCEEFLTNFSALELDSRVGVVAFGDLTIEGDRIVATPFMTQLEQIQKTLRKIPRYGGGGNEGESAFEAIEAALEMPHRPEAVKVCVLITDEPALQNTLSPSGILGRITEHQVITYVVSPPIDYYKEIASRSGGAWMQITSAADFSSLLGMLKNLAKSVATIVNDVHLLAGGSVATYLKLDKPKE
jgi:Mg-chelatase subunit ChlD